MSLEKEIMDISVTYIIYYKQSSFTIINCKLEYKLDNKINCKLQFGL